VTDPSRNHGPKNYGKSARGVLARAQNAKPMRSRTITHGNEANNSRRGKGRASLPRVSFTSIKTPDTRGLKVLLRRAGDRKKTVFEIHINPSLLRKKKGDAFAIWAGKEKAQKKGGEVASRPSKTYQK